MADSPVPHPVPVEDSHVQGRQARYAEIRAAHGPALARVASTYASSAAERDDLIQEIALAIWTALPRFRGEASVRTFVFRIAHNCGVSHLRRRRPAAAAAEVPDGAPTAQHVLEVQSDRDRLMAAIAELGVAQRQVLTLSLEGLSYAEIAEVLGLSEKNVSVRLTRARQSLRKRLGGER